MASFFLTNSILPGAFNDDSPFSLTKSPTSPINPVVNSKEISAKQQGFEVTQKNLATQLEDIKKKIEESENNSESSSDSTNKDDLLKQQKMLEHLMAENKRIALIAKIKEQHQEKMQKQSELQASEKHFIQAESLREYQEARERASLIGKKHSSLSLNISPAISTESIVTQEISHDAGNHQIESNSQAKQAQAQEKLVVGEFTQKILRERSPSLLIEKKEQNTQKQPSPISHSAAISLQRSQASSLRALGG